MTVRPTATSPWFPLIVLIVALVPLGAIPAPALNTVLLLVSLGFLVHLATLLLRGGVTATTESLLFGTSPVLLMALPAYVAFQLVMRLALGGNGPVFVVTQSTVELIGLALYYVLVRGAVSDPQNLRILLCGLALIGGAEALYGLLNLLAGNERLLIWERWIFWDSATGTLSSRNHFAYLMEMLLPASIAFAVVFGRGEVNLGAGFGPAERTSRTALIGIISVLTGLGLIFSHSRMGILSFTIASGTVLLLNRTLRQAVSESDREGFSWTAIATCGAAVGLALTAAMGLDSVLERFLSVENDFVSGRLPIWHAALAMFVASPLFGQGWGTFQSLLPSYRAEPNGFYYTHAHNDYFQILAEGGVVGFAIATVLVFLFARRFIQALSMPLAASQRTVICWLGIAITSVLLHSFADYGLRTAGVAFTFATLLAIFTRVTEQPELVTARRSRHRRSRSRD